MSCNRADGDVEVSEVAYSKHMIGSDGAHSKTTAQLGISIR